MSNRLHRRVTWGELFAAVLLTGLLILAEGRGGAAHRSSLVIHGLGVACFVLFVVWFARAIYLSVQGAPDYALFGYSILAFCVVSWGLAFFYPLPLHHWRDLLYRDLAFFVGVPGPLVLLLLLAVGKLLFSTEARQRLGRSFGQSRQDRWKLWCASALFVWFLGFCGTRIMPDIQDLTTEPQTAMGTLRDYYHATRSVDDTATFEELGTLRVPHGLTMTFLQRGQRYQVMYTPHARLLVGIRPERRG